MVNKLDIYKAASSSVRWLKDQKLATVKDLSRAIQALSVWKQPTSGLTQILLSRRKDGFWETEKPLLDTARACSALAACGITQHEVARWILEQQENSNWRNNEIDTAYSLIALGDLGIKNELGCEWLFHNYGEKWEHAGTTSLIITALIKQNRSKYRDFIKNRRMWLLSKRQLGGWIHITTSNLALHALILSGEGDIEQDNGPSIQWLLGKQEKDNWGDITSTSLSLISLKMYLDSIDARE